MVLWRFARAAASILICCLLGQQAFSSTVPTRENLCLTAAANAAAASQVPEAILIALTRSESSHLGSPWPWALNIDGQGHWPEDAFQAQRLIASARGSGARSIDVGCFQINQYWHGANFPSVAAMLDPETNAAYAAAFLLRLYREKGTWPAAIAAYHSRTPEIGQRYLARFETFYEAERRLPPRATPPTRARAPQHDRRLLSRRAAALFSLSGRRIASAGSLVPVAGGEDN
ncbi:transglycosylase SLT domain-containing protein [Pelagovum sp. HNIBRBA483]|uniref:transglycosylase SLT domain-containing protein n=1 Tax=Pelagovum sp. HNIBRBA483 TaxID=3233341 RepID=UPI0034A46BA9